MRTQRRKSRNMRKSIALFLALLMVVAGFNFTFATSQSGVDPVFWNERQDPSPDEGCAGYKVDSVKSATFKFEDLVLLSGSETGLVDEDDSVTITVTKTVYGEEFQWSSDVEISRVVAKGGPVSNIYKYPSGSYGDSGLHAPLNENSGEWYGLSHITFYICFEQEDDPDDGTVLIKKVVEGEAPDNGDPFVVKIEDSEGDIVGTMNLNDGDEDNLDLAPGTYYVKETDTQGADDVEYDVKYEENNNVAATAVNENDDWFEIEVFENQTTTVTVTNTFDEPGEPEKEIELEIIKKVVTVDDGMETEITEIDGEAIGEFEVTLFYAYAPEDRQMVMSAVWGDTFAGEYYPKPGDSDGKISTYTGEHPDLTPYYTVKETEMADDAEFTLLRYEVKFYDKEGDVVVDDTETDEEYYLDLTKNDNIAPAYVEITVVNRYDPPEIPDGTVWIKKVVEGSAPDNDDPFVVEIKDSEEKIVGSMDLNDGDQEDLDLAPGIYYVKETVTRGADDIDYDVEYEQNNNVAATAVNGNNDWIEIEIFANQTTTVTVTNTFDEPKEPGEPEDPDKGTVQVKKVVEGAGPENGDPFVVEIKDSEDVILGTMDLNDGDEEDLDLDPGTYYVKETATQGADDVEYDVEYEVSNDIVPSVVNDNDGWIKIIIYENQTTTVTVINTFDPPADVPPEDTPPVDVPPTDPPRGTPSRRPLPSVTTEIEIEEVQIPEGVPAPPVEAPPEETPPEIILDEEPPRGVPGPELPQTGEGNPLYFYLAGLLLAGTGLAIRKRITN